MKTFLQYFAYAVLFICSTLVIKAQSQEWLWAKTVGGSGHDISNSIATDRTGNIYVTGKFSSPQVTIGPTTYYNSDNGEDMFIIKYASDGNVLWAKTYRGEFDAGGIKSAVDSEGNMYVAGSFFSVTFENTQLISSGSNDIFIVKYDPFGNEIWAKSAGGAGRDYAHSITIDKYDNVYVAGDFIGGSISFDTIDIKTSQGMFLTKYNKNGNAIWAKIIRESNTELNITSHNESIYMLGYFDRGIVRFDTIALQNMEGKDIFIAKYDNNGNVLWARSTIGNGQIRGKSITTDKNENIYVTGQIIQSPVFFDTIPVTKLAGSSDIFIAKYDANGNVLWVKTAGGKGDESGNSMVTDTSGNIFVAGGFASRTVTFDSLNLENSSELNLPPYSDVFVTKFDSVGKMVWAKSIGGYNNEVANGITIDSRQNIFLTGFFDSYTANFGDTQLGNFSPGLRDMFIAGISGITTSVTEQIAIFTEILAFPNPTASQFHISNLEPGNWTITIYTLDGQSVFKKEISESNAMIDLSGKAKGAYVYRLLKDGDIFKTGKILVE